MDLNHPELQSKSGKLVQTSEPVDAESADAWEFPTATPMLSEDIAFLVKYGCDFGVLVEVEKRSRQLNLSAASVLITSGRVDQETYYECLAHDLDLEFCRAVPVDPQPLPVLHNPENLHKFACVQPVSSPHTHSNGHFGPLNYYLAPDRTLIRLLKAHLRREPQIRHRIKVCSHETNLSNLVARSSPSLLSKSTNGLSDSLPQFSARQTFTVVQSIGLLLLVQAVAGLWILFDTAVPILLHLSALYLYVGRAGLRISAWHRFDAGRDGQALCDFRDDELTYYSVLVALYDEEDVVAELVSSLTRLDWPPELLEIKLICEADDVGTIAACESVIAQVAAPIFKVVKVPACEPRTKPKALNYALPLCRGEFVVVYDAEDRPHPAQLKQAFKTFRNGKRNLACLQAPLVIENHASGWLARMFAIEYSALFGGLLPAMARKELPLPLGGSSNHFKRQTLVEIGAWDPYNVTEDADLGLRLARAGCLAGTIDCPTYETAPTDFNIWLRQRTRWFKGWYQTLLVHSRHPWQLKQDLELVGLFSFLLMTLGLALSALANPFLFSAVIAIAAEAAAGNIAVWKLCLLIADSLCILTGYGAFVLLAARTLGMHDSGPSRSGLWMLPLYWLLMSFAAWRALWQLLRCPHKWEKTPHIRRQFEPTTKGSDLR